MPTERRGPTQGGLKDRFPLNLIVVGVALIRIGALLAAGDVGSSDDDEDDVSRSRAPAQDVARHMRPGRSQPVVRAPRGKLPSLEDRNRLPASQPAKAEGPARARLALATPGSQGLRGLVRRPGGTPPTAAAAVAVVGGIALDHQYRLAAWLHLTASGPFASFVDAAAAAQNSRRTPAAVRRLPPANSGKLQVMTVNHGKPPRPGDEGKLAGHPRFPGAPPAGIEPAHTAPEA